MILTNIRGCGDREAAPQGHVSGQVGGVGRAGVQNVADTHGVDGLGLDTDAGDGGIGGQHLEVHGTVTLQRATKGSEWSSLGRNNKDTSGENISCCHLASIVWVFCNLQIKYIINEDTSRLDTD